MRKHSVRKFIHAVLDCLPLLVIPIFAIYSQNHEINDNTLQVQENKVVDFNQYNNYYNYENLNVDGLVFNTNGNTINLNGTLNNSSGYVFRAYSSSQTTFTIYANHKYAVKGASDLRDNINNAYYHIPGVAGGMGSMNIDQIYIPTQTATNRIVYIYLENQTILDYDSYFSLYDLTQMFGEGNEPTIEQFNTYFPNSYYPYTESEEVVIENYETITYNDTDIMSQFMYVTYNAVDKYFNMNKVFNLGNIWQWVQNTLFNGSAPLSAFIVYNVIMYEFIMDIIFLVYLVLMFVIDFAESGIDRFMKRGCR